MFDKSISADDRLEVLELYARYCFAADMCDGEGWANCFVPDGEFRPAMVSADGPVKGREALAKFQARTGQVPGKMRHWLNNIVMERIGESLRVRYYASLADVSGEGGPKIVGSVTCDDIVVRHEGAWLFKLRSSTPDRKPD